MKGIVYSGLILIFLLCFSIKSDDQEIQRPAVWGIAKITFMVSDDQNQDDTRVEFTEAHIVK